MGLRGGRHHQAPRSRRHFIARSSPSVAPRSVAASLRRGAFGERRPFVDRRRIVPAGILPFGSRTSMRNILACTRIGDMATLVCFHAHPDDEAVSTAGTMVKAAADGHRVVLVVATRGEHGEVEDGFLNSGEELWQRRVQETAAAAEILGVARHEFLGYRDSGMMGTSENDAPDAFWQADLDEAAERLARILREEQADVLTIYD